MKKRQRHLTGRLIVIILLAILAVYSFFVGPLRALTNDILLGGLLNLSVAFAIMLAFFFLTLRLVGSRTLPVNPRDKQEKATARGLLRRFATGGRVAMAVVRDGAVEPGPSGESREHVWGHGVIDVDSTSVVTLHTDVGLSRIRGTGLVFMRDSEQLQHIVDLRIQARSQEFEFTTRDGIPVKVRLTLRFQIDQATFNQNLHAHDPRAPFPAPMSWSIRPVARALANLQVADAGGPLTKWSDLPLMFAKGMLGAIVAEYRLDDLLSPLEPDRNPRRDIREQLTARLKPVLMQQGVKVFSLGLGMFLPHGFDADKTFNQEKPELDEITAQRVKAWKAEWESRVIKLTAEGQAEANRRRDLARTQAQIELITRVTQALEQEAPAIIDNQDQIARRFLETLQKMADEPYTRAHLEDENVLLLGAALSQNDRSEPHEPPAAP